MLLVFRDDDGGVGVVVIGPGTAGDTFRRLEADIDMGGRVVDSISSGSSIGCMIPPNVDGPPNDFVSMAGPPLFVIPWLSHDNVRRRGAQNSPDTSVRDDKKE